MYLQTWTELLSPEFPDDDALYRYQELYNIDRGKQVLAEALGDNTLRDRQNSSYTLILSKILLFSLCIKSTIAVFKMPKQLSEENGGGPFCQQEKLSGANIY